MIIPEPKKLASGDWYIQLRLAGQSIMIKDANKRNCEKKALAVKSAHRAGMAEQQRARADRTVRSVMDGYISAKKNTLSPSTIRGYSIIAKQRFVSCAGQSIASVTAMQWQSIINTEASLCSPKTLKNAWGFLRSAAKFYSVTLPCVTLPAKIPHDARFLTPAQITAFVPAAYATKYAVPLLCALSGMRMSEIDGLYWDAIPEQPEFIKIVNTRVMDQGNHFVEKKTAKNATSRRNVPILIPELKQAIARDRVAGGKVLSTTQSSVRDALKKICEQEGLPVVGMHGLRHSFASLAYHLHIPEKIAMEIGGWADERTMHEIYTHIAQEDIDHYKSELLYFYSPESKPPVVKRVKRIQKLPRRSL